MAGVTIRDAREGGTPAAGRGGLGATLRTHRAEAIGLVGVAAVVVVAIAKGKRAPAATSPPAAGGGAGIATSAAAAQPAGTYWDTSSSYDALQQQIQQLQGALAGQGAGSPSLALGHSPPNYSGEPMMGSGYGTPPGSGGLTDLAGRGWVPLSPAAGAALPAGTPIYFQPSPGVVTEIGPTGQAWPGALPGTPLYLPSPA